MTSFTAFAPGREGTVIGIARLSRLVATGPLARRVGFSALTPRRLASSVGASQLAGRGGFGLGPVLLGLSVERNRLPQRGARPVVRKSLVHRLAPKAGRLLALVQNNRCPGFRAERESCHGAFSRSIAP